jgi:hypothetical protein
MYDYRYGENVYFPSPGIGITTYTDPLTARVADLEATVASIVSDFYSDPTPEPEVVVTNTTNSLSDLGRDTEILKLKEQIERLTGDNVRYLRDLDDAIEENDRLAGRLAEAEYALNEINSLSSID